MKNVIIYTDGACSGNPGPGGWAAILIYGEYKKKVAGYEEETTNNRMELIAVIQGLKTLKESCAVKLHSDSQYVVSAINEGWLEKWKANGWKGSNKKPVKNQELWLELDELLNKHVVEFVKVEGHSDNELNNECDRLAVDQYQKIRSFLKASK